MERAVQNLDKLIEQLFAIQATDNEAVIALIVEMLRQANEVPFMSSTDASRMKFIIRRFGGQVRNRKKENEQEIDSTFFNSF